MTNSRIDNINLKQYRPFDEDSVRQLHREGLEQTDNYIDNPEYNCDVNNIIVEYIQKDGDFFIPTYNRPINNMGDLKSVVDETTETKWIQVTPVYQGHDIGELILDNIIRKARELGYKKLVLDTTAKQLIAQQLYQKRGFR